jgi:CHAD domain-containing protein
MNERARGTTFILPEALHAEEIEPALRRVAGLEEVTGKSGPFRLLDSFDGSIRKSGRALIESGGRLVLVGGTGGTLTQDVRGRPRLVGDLPDGALKAALETVSPLRSLLSRAEGTACCRDLRAVDDERKTVARLSFLTLRATAAQGVTIATVHGLRGYDAAFESISSEVANLDGTPAAAADLYALLGAEDAGPEAGPRGRVPPGTPAYDMAADLVRGFLAQALRCEPGIVADWDTEFLHDYRVALRKLRSVLSLFRGVFDETERLRLQTETRALMVRTGALRDLDVQLLDRAAYREILPVGLHDGLDLLFDRLARQRAREQRQLARWLRSPDYAAAVSALRDRLDDPARAAAGPHGARPAGDLLRDLVGQRWKKTGAAARRLGVHSSDEELHDLRIRCKKLRYLLDFSTPVFGAAGLRPLVRPLKELQEELGLFNDYSVQSALLEQILPASGPKGKADLAIARSVGALTAILHQRKAAQRARVDASLAAFSDSGLRRRYARWLSAGEA